MKKLLVIAMFAALAASSFAAEFTIGSEVEYWGVMHNLSYDIDTKGAGEGSDTAAFNHYLAQFVGKLNVDDTNFNFRMRFQDSFTGKNNGTGNMADRYWLDHTIGSVKVSLGRMGQSHSSGLFARDWFDMSGAMPWGSSTRDMIKAEYKLSDTVGLFFIADKWAESENGNPFVYNNTPDKTVYVVGAKIKTNGDLAIDPSVSYLHGSYEDDSGVVYGDQAFGAKVNVAYKPATGLQAEVALAMYKQQSNLFGNDNNGDALKPMLFGAMADVAWAADFGKAGFFVAYGSSDEDSGAAFSFGDDWNRTKIIDDGLWSSSPGVPPTGFMQVAFYADVKFGDKLTFSPIFAYYLNQSESYVAKWNSKGLHEDAGMMEIDLTAKYQLTKELTLGAGVAYAMFSDFGDQENQLDANTSAAEDTGFNQITAYWNVMAKF